jgi:imidazolonepropionase-like amidohydrolase
MNVLLQTTFAGIALIVMAAFASPGPALAEEAAEKQVLFQNVNIFNGTDDKLYENHHVLVEGNKIVQISETAIEADGATVIDGGGRTLMPGLIDLHAHFLANGDKGLADLEANFTWEDLAIRAAVMAKRHFMDGFTSARDMGGANGGLRRQIDAGVIVGPRVYTSGAWIGPPGGHSDFRNYTMPATPGITQTERLNIAVNVNGPDDVTRVARQNFMQGATQLKIMQTGGVASP